MSITWDPAVAPDPQTWLALSDVQRVETVAAWHQGHLPDALHIEPTDPAVHARLHSVIETQIAVADPVEVGTTVARLVEATVVRHLALHAVMRVFVEHMHLAMRAPGGFDDDAYAAALRALVPADVVAAALRVAAGGHGRP